ncbi:helix-turn-helix domain-containing protein [Erythrobacter sp.]|uniref:helix-turn-helix domain-containing protein n=1 Tax=Erythrobacter sp. TaxID=1042 RepID=UPI003C77D835
MTREIDPKLADSQAARMLSEGIARASSERGLSLRKIGALLGYKQAVVLSHMTSGRVPIPIDRAEEIAEVLEIDPAAFLQAVVRQRHPTVTWSLMGAGGDKGDGFTHELAVSLGRPLKELSQEQRAVMREVAAEPRPRRRWLTVHELTAIELLREVQPAFSSEGLGQAEMAAIRDALRAATE